MSARNEQTATEDITGNTIDDLESAAADLGGGPTLQSMLTEILRECRTPSEVFELYYWSQEPGLVALFRSMAQLPESTRKAMEFFLSHVDDSSPVSMTQSKDGKEVLLSLRVSKRRSLQDAKAN